MCTLGAGDGAREEERAGCPQHPPQPALQRVQHDPGPAVPAGALWSHQPDQAEGHSQGRATLITMDIRGIWFHGKREMNAHHVTHGHVFTAEQLLVLPAATHISHLR